jgi:hypothetical protein
MFRLLLVLGATLLLAIAPYDSLANCYGEIEGPGTNHIGTVALLSKRSGGPEHHLLGSEFWALTGPYDTHLLRAYPVRFDSAAMQIVDTWDWSNAAVSPFIVDVRVDAKMDGDFLWLQIREILQTEEQYRAAVVKYDKPRQGLCGSVFRLK